MAGGLTMITWPDFQNTVLHVLRLDIASAANPEQHQAISADPSTSLFIVAGPGSGKTSAIVLRILKLIFVDDINPATILATTFTRKAAAELRSRVLGWGDELRQAFLAMPGYQEVSAELRDLDFNVTLTGTIDSMAEQLLTDYRQPGVAAPMVLEAFVANALMLRVGLFSSGRHNSSRLRNYVARLMGAGVSPHLTTSGISTTVREIRDRVVQDVVDVFHYEAAAVDPGVPVVCDAIDDYERELEARGLFDFPRLGAEFLAALEDGLFAPFLTNLRYLVVDEYQDTNLLQERTYLELSAAALGSRGSISVVGDDDQSLYRFRGATVDLFRHFPNRFPTAHARTIHLAQNYRSTREVVRFVNDFVQLDCAYQAARVAMKPPIRAARSQPYMSYPVLGMFRDTIATLAVDLACFIYEVVHGPGFTVNDQGTPLSIQLNPESGSSADIAFLASSPLEFRLDGTTPRLPHLLRTELAHQNPPIPVFNPRGRSLERVPAISTLCGLILECIDPAATVQTAIPRLPRAIIATLRRWRSDARSFLDSDPRPHRPYGLPNFVAAWATRTSLRRRIQRRENVPLNDLVYKLLTWLPDMQDDPEHLVYLEGITRTISQSALFGSFGAEIIFENGVYPLSPLAQASVREAIWNIFTPLATGAIEINEDLLETLPRDRISIMSIHQAKGLEFPLVVVDAGSDFSREHPRQAFKRFPSDPGKACNLEDALRPYSPLGPPTRLGIDRAFDDLVRQYFVAYSRPQDVLLLVGLNAVRNRVRNIATGWDRAGTWHWGPELPNLVHV